MPKEKIYKKQTVKFKVAFKHDVEFTIEFTPPIYSEFCPTQYSLKVDGGDVLILRPLAEIYLPEEEKSK